MVFKDFARMGVPLEIGGRADESVPFVKRASLNAPLQWKLWSPEICECVTMKVRSTRLFWRKRLSTLRFLISLRHTPLHFHWNSEGIGVGRLV